MQIIQKDISWLIERVPDFEEFYLSHQYKFNGGFLAGGFLRKIINRGSYKQIMNDMRESKIRGDIDWFFYTQEECLAVVKEFYSKDARSFNKNNPPKIPNSFTKFAFEEIDKYHIKQQFIYKSVGTPQEILNRFDISNCKIATDGKNVWMIEDWEKLENNKIIRVDNLKGEYILSRLKKYLTEDYDLEPSNKDEILFKMLSSVTESKWHGTIKKLVSHAKFLKPEFIVMFYDKLGTICDIAPEDYAKTSLADLEPKRVDYALHIYKERVKND